MSGKRCTKKTTSGNKSAFTAEEYKLIKECTVGDLLDEIFLNRVILLRTVDEGNSADG